MIINGKGRQVNKKLENICLQSNHLYISNHNIKPRYHYNDGGIHLNNTSSKIPAENVVIAVNSLS